MAGLLNQFRDHISPEATAPGGATLADTDGAVSADTDGAASADTGGAAAADTVGAATADTVGAATADTGGAALADTTIPLMDGAVESPATPVRGSLPAGTTTPSEAPSVDEHSSPSPSLLTKNAGKEAFNLEISPTSMLLNCWA